MAEQLEIKEPQNDDKNQLENKEEEETAESIQKVESELKELKKQLYKIEEKIRYKQIELSSIMARSVSVTDIDEILGLVHQSSDGAASLSLDSMNDADDSMNEEVTPSPTSSETSKTPKKSKKKKKKGVNKKREATKLWKELEEQIKNGNIEYCKKLIQLKKIKINDNQQWNGRTILMMAAEHGQYNICSMLINLGADVRMTTKYDKRDASHFAGKMGHYHIERLLLISSFGGESSAKINEMIETLKKQQAINNDFLNTFMKPTDDEKEQNDAKWIEQMTNYLCQLIQKKKVFSDDMLSLCWSYIVYKGINNGNSSNRVKYDNDALNSELWKVIKKSCQDVVQSKDPNLWYWLKECMLKSTIWLQPHPEILISSKENTSDGLDGLLIKELFLITNAESSKQSEKLKIMEKKFEAEWKSLINFDIETKYGPSPRQDSIPNGLIAKYSKEELSQNINPSTTFNALKHYDINQYLPHLVLICHIINDDFQQSIMDIFGINGTTNSNMDGSVKYRRGPIKQISRCKAKTENDYRTEEYPTSAHLLDVVRCTLSFKDVNSLLSSLKEFEDAINNNKGGAIKEIVRIKNGFKEWNRNYADIKLNVLIQTDDQYAVIGEVQWLLYDMSIFKLSAHKLYSILRLDEEYLNLLKIKPILMDHEKCLLNASYFNGSKEISNLMVIHQKNNQFLRNKIDLKIVCKTNGLKLLKLLNQYMNNMKLKLKNCGGFQICCNKGYLDMIKYIYLVIIPTDIESYDDVLRNGLTEIISNGHYEILKWMFSENKKFGQYKFLNLWQSFDAIDKHTFFRGCCEQKNSNTAKLLVSHFGPEFDINDKSSGGYCALTKAINKKRIETVKWLINFPKIDLFAENQKRGRISLFDALDVGCIEIGDLLLSQCKKQDNDPRTPRDMLMYKSSLGHTIQVFVKSAGKRGSKRKEAVQAIKKWAAQYKVVELQTIKFDFASVKFQSM